MKMLETNILKTKKRRAIQPLFNALNKTVGPYLSKGLLLAISGGPDSRALLESISKWPKRNTGRILVVCCDHQIRCESDEESKAVRARAMVLGFEAEIVKLNIGTKKDEGSLRNFRYSALWKIAKEKSIKAICTGHHSDDSVEGYLLNLFGFGGGISGSALSKYTKMSSGIILRPFADISRCDLLLFLSSLNFIDYFQDPLDLKQVSRRSSIRYDLLPSLRKYYNCIDNRLFKLSKKAFVDEEILNKICKEKESLCIKSKNLHEVIIDLFDQPRAIAKRILKNALSSLIKKKDLRSADKTIEKILDSLDQELDLSILKIRKKLSFNLPYAIAIVDKNNVIIRKNN